jgi:hypothetical protein
MSQLTWTDRLFKRRYDLFGGVSLDDVGQRSGVRVLGYRQAQPPLSIATLVETRSDESHG